MPTTAMTWVAALLATAFLACRAQPAATVESIPRGELQQQPFPISVLSVDMRQSLAGNNDLYFKTVDHSCALLDPDICAARRARLAAQTADASAEGLAFDPACRPCDQAPDTPLRIMQSKSAPDWFQAPDSQNPCVCTLSTSYSVPDLADGPAEMAYDNSGNAFALFTVRDPCAGVAFRIESIRMRVDSADGVYIRNPFRTLYEYAWAERYQFDLCPDDPFFSVGTHALQLYAVSAFNALHQLSARLVHPVLRLPGPPQPCVNAATHLCVREGVLRLIDESYSAPAFLLPDLDPSEWIFAEFPLDQSAVGGPSCPSVVHVVASGNFLTSAYGVQLFASLLHPYPSNSSTAEWSSRLNTYYTGFQRITVNLDPTEPTCSGGRLYIGIGRGVAGCSVQLRVMSVQVPMTIRPYSDVGALAPLSWVPPSELQFAFLTCPQRTFGPSLPGTGAPVPLALADYARPFYTTIDGYSSVPLPEINELTPWGSGEFQSHLVQLVITPKWLSSAALSWSPPVLRPPVPLPDDWLQSCSVSVRGLYVRADSVPAGTDDAALTDADLISVPLSNVPLRAVAPLCELAEFTLWADRITELNAQLANSSAIAQASDAWTNALQQSGLLLHPFFVRCYQMVETMLLDGPARNESVDVWSCDSPPLSPFCCSQTSTSTTSFQRLVPTEGLHSMCPSETVGSRCLTSLLEDYIDTNAAAQTCSAGLLEGQSFATAQYSAMLECVVELFGVDQTQGVRCPLDGSACPVGHCDVRMGVCVTSADELDQEFLRCLDERLDTLVLVELVQHLVALSGQQQAVLPRLTDLYNSSALGLQTCLRNDRTQDPRLQDFVGFGPPSAEYPKYLERCECLMMPSTMSFSSLTILAFESPNCIGADAIGCYNFYVNTIQPQSCPVASATCNWRASRCQRPYRTSLATDGFMADSVAFDVPDALECERLCNQHGSAPVCAYCEPDSPAPCSLAYEWGPAANSSEPVAATAANGMCSSLSACLVPYEMELQPLPAPGASSCDPLGGCSIPCYDSVCQEQTDLVEPVCVLLSVSDQVECDTVAGASAWPVAWSSVSRLCVLRSALVANASECERVSSVELGLATDSSLFQDPAECTALNLTSCAACDSRDNEQIGGSGCPLPGRSLIRCVVVQRERACRDQQECADGTNECDDRAQIRSIRRNFFYPHREWICIYPKPGGVGQCPAVDGQLSVTYGSGCLVVDPSMWLGQDRARCVTNGGRWTRLARSAAECSTGQQHCLEQAPSPVPLSLVRPPLGHLLPHPQWSYVSQRQGTACTDLCSATLAPAFKLISPVWRPAELVSLQAITPAYGAQASVQRRGIDHMRLSLRITEAVLATQTTRLRQYSACRVTQLAGTVRFVVDQCARPAPARDSALISADELGASTRPIAFRTWCGDSVLSMKVPALIDLEFAPLPNASDTQACNQFELRATSLSTVRRASSTLLPSLFAAHRANRDFWTMQKYGSGIALGPGFTLVSTTPNGLGLQNGSSLVASMSLCLRRQASVPYASAADAAGHEALRNWIRFPRPGIGFMREGDRISLRPWPNAIVPRWADDERSAVCVEVTGAQLTELVRTGYAGRRVLLVPVALRAHYERFESKTTKFGSGELSSLFVIGMLYLLGAWLVFVFQIRAVIVGEAGFVLGLMRMAVLLAFFTRALLMFVLVGEANSVASNQGGLVLLVELPFLFLFSAISCVAVTWLVLTLSSSIVRHPIRSFSLLFGAVNASVYVLVLVPLLVLVIWGPFNTTENQCFDRWSVRTDTVTAPLTISIHVIVAVLAMVTAVFLVAVAVRLTWKGTRFRRFTVIVLGVAVVCSASFVASCLLFVILTAVSLGEASAPAAAHAMWVLVGIELMPFFGVVAVLAYVAPSRLGAGAAGSRHLPRERGEQPQQGAGETANSDWIRRDEKSSPANPPVRLPAAAVSRIASTSPATLPSTVISQSSGSARSRAESSSSSSSSGEHTDRIVSGQTR